MVDTQERYGQERLSNTADKWKAKLDPEKYLDPGRHGAGHQDSSSLSHCPLLINTANHPEDDDVFKKQLLKQISSRT